MKRFENILIATDLDGTFLNSNGKTVARNLEMIEYFKNNGGRFTVATGRTPYNVLDVLPNVAKLINTPAVTVNGTCLYDFSKDKVVAEYLMDIDDALEIVKYVRSIDASFGIRAAILRGFITDDESNPHLHSDFLRAVVSDRKVLPLDEWKNESIYKVAIRAEAKKIDMLREFVERDFSERMTITRGWATIFEVFAKGRGKGVMLRELCEKEGIKTLITVGDYDNDIDMHMAADISVCPANAQESVKRIVDYSLCDNDTGVIADIIERLERGELKK